MPVRFPSKLLRVVASGLERENIVFELNCGLPSICCVL